MQALGDLFKHARKLFLADYIVSLDTVLRGFATSDALAKTGLRRFIASLERDVKGVMAVSFPPWHRHAGDQLGPPLQLRSKVLYGGDRLRPPPGSTHRAVGLRTRWRPPRGAWEGGRLGGGVERCVARGNWEVRGGRGPGGTNRSWSAHTNGRFFHL